MTVVLPDVDGDDVRRRDLARGGGRGVHHGEPGHGCAAGDVDRLRALRRPRRRCSPPGGRFDAGVWRQRTPAERAEVLRGLADLMEKHHEELAQLVTAEVGSPISLARSLQTATPVVNFRWAADRAVVRAAWRLPRGASGPDRAGARGERAAARADRRGHRHHAVQLPDQHGGLEGRARPGGGLLGRAAALPAGHAVHAGLRAAGRGGRRPGRGAQPGHRRCRRRRTRLVPPGRGHGDVHRLQRGGRGRDEGGGPDEQEARARARRQVAHRGAARRRPRPRRRAFDAALLPQRRSGLWSDDPDPGPSRRCRRLPGEGRGVHRRARADRRPHRRGDRGRSAHLGRAPGPRGGLPRAGGRRAAPGS